MSSTCRWGILSTALHAKNLVIPAMHEAPNAVPAAVASRDAARARAYADELSIPTSYSSYEDLLADPGIDAVYIPLPNHMHKEWAIRAAEAGKHVLCEKPIALNAAEAEEMARAFEGTGLKLAEAFQWRHHPQAIIAREMLREGAIGPLNFISAEFSITFDDPSNIRAKPETGGGSLYDVGCYPVSLTRFMAGEPVAVTAQIRWNAMGVDDLVVATLEYPGGVLAQIACGFTLPWRDTYEIVGPLGALEVHRAYNPQADHPGQIFRNGERKQHVETINLEAVNSYMLMIRDFSAVVLDGTPALYGGEDAVNNMRVIDAIFRSAREGVRVELS